MLDGAIVIDDKESAGQAVCKTLWKNGYSCHFFQYDSENPVEHLPKLERKKTGVRIIFLDINLIDGGSSPTTADYDAAVEVITYLLDEKNGPWLLAIWSTYQDEHDHAQKVFDHLKKELDIDGISQPFAYVKLDKEKFTVRGLHSEVKEPLSSGELGNVFSLIQDRLKQVPAFHAVMKWEASVNANTSEVVKSLIEPPLKWGVDNQNNVLAGMFYEIGRAEVGAKTGDKTEISTGVARVINQLVASNISAQGVFDTAGIVKFSGQDKSAAQKREMSRRINKVLHIEDSTKPNRPGQVYIFKKPPHYYSDSDELLDSLKAYYSDDILKAELLKNHIDHASYQQTFNASKVVMIDITPSCDHANKKAHWRKLLVGVQVVVPSIDIGSKGKIKKFIDGFNEASKWKGPCVSVKTDDVDSEAQFLYMDLRMVMSIPDDPTYIDSLHEIYTLRDPALRTLSAAFANHVSRPGIVDVASF